MRIKVAQVGNSKGVRIPKAMIRTCGLKDEVEIEVKKGVVVISPAAVVREGWADAAKTISAKKEKWEW